MAPLPYLSYSEINYNVPGVNSGQNMFIENNKTVVKNEEYQKNLLKNEIAGQIITSNSQLAEPHKNNSTCPREEKRTEIPPNIPETGPNNFGSPQLIENPVEFANRPAYSNINNSWPPNNNSFYNRFNSIFPSFNNRKEFFNKDDNMISLLNEIVFYLKFITLILMFCLILKFFNK